MLREWNPSVAGRSLALLHEAAMELLAAHGGYAAACEEGTLLAAFPAVVRKGMRLSCAELPETLRPGRSPRPS